MKENEDSATTSSSCCSWQEVWAKDGGRSRRERRCYKSLTGEQRWAVSERKRLGSAIQDLVKTMRLRLVRLGAWIFWFPSLFFRGGSTLTCPVPCINTWTTH